MPVLGGRGDGGGQGAVGQGRAATLGRGCTFSTPVSGGDRHEWESFKRKTHGRQLLGDG